MSGFTPTRPLKAVVLAAGHDEKTRDLLVRPLADSTVVQLLLASVTALVPQADVTIVIAEGDSSIPDLLGPGWNYVPQTVQAGTGDAVRCARQQLSGFDGDVLIAYGDTPLLHPASLRGLVNRHRLKNAQLSLLTAVIDNPAEYGRIVRDSQDYLQAIVEPEDMTGELRDNLEINVGAYVARSEVLMPTLDEMAERGEHRLTEMARKLIAADRHSIATYRIYDHNEVQGINDDQELAAAADIVLKRLFSPRKTAESGHIAFGTGGWRALIGEGYTLPNVRRLCQAVANEITRGSREREGVVIGGDRRFLSRESAEAAAEVFAGNNIPVILLPDDVPTPLVTFATPYLKCAYGLVFTASHNPPQWNGLKVFRADGSLPLEDETNRYEDEANSLTPNEIITLDLPIAREAGMVLTRDLNAPYIDAIEGIVDVDAMKGADLRILVDPMYGTSQLTLGTILSDARLRVEFIHERHNPLFGGRSPAPDPEALGALIGQIKTSGRYNLGMATDGDADRIAIVDEKGEFITTNDLLLLVYWYMHEVRGEKGGIVRNLATTHLLDRLAAHYGETYREVPVGFKHITAGMAADDALLGGESSGGLTLRGWILGKDGIFACALVVEMLARTGRKLTDLLADIYAITGRLYDLETGVSATPDMRIEIPRRLASYPPTEVAGYPVARIDSFDGFKIHLEDEDWALLRFSGTEPVLRMFVEASSPAKAQEMIAWLSDYVQGA